MYYMIFYNTFPVPAPEVVELPGATVAPGYPPALTAWPGATIPTPVVVVCTSPDFTKRSIAFAISFAKIERPSTLNCAL